MKFTALACILCCGGRVHLITDVSSV